MQITIREPGSAFTHLAGMVLAAIATIPLLLWTATTSNSSSIVAMIIFAASMVLLYGASTLYHSVNLQGKYLEFFRKIDHMMIFVLIAGSYTPVCIIVLGGNLGYNLLLLIWGIALVGMLVKALWITCPKWFSSIIYQPEDKLIADYETYNTWCQDAEKYGIDCHEIIGWDKGGLERDYPDYVPEEKLGGKEGFQSLLQSIKSRNSKSLVFVNYNIQCFVSYKSFRNIPQSLVWTSFSPRVFYHIKLISLFVFCNSKDLHSMIVGCFIVIITNLTFILGNFFFF